MSSSQRGYQEFRAELQIPDSKDKKFVKRKTALKKIVANITMGNDSQSLVSVMALMLNGCSVALVPGCCTVLGYAITRGQKKCDAFVLHLPVRKGEFML